MLYNSHVNFALCQEYNKCQAKVDKYQDRERTGPNIVKLDQVNIYIYLI